MPKERKHTNTKKGSFLSSIISKEEKEKKEAMIQSEKKPLRIYKLENKRRSKKQRTKEESETAKEERRAKKRQWTADSRARLTLEEKMEVRRKDKERKREKRKNESEAERQLRREKDKLRKRRKRSLLRRKMLSVTSSAPPPLPDKSIYKDTTKV